VSFALSSLPDIYKPQGQIETLDAMCRTLACRAGDLIEYVAETRSTRR